ncbi:MAG: UDP-N-acetylglucosamine--N-acetylmuramyl-(pentapeptide) pyrophosphoryl-undecaprenol N-acetylglucosamine transferase [Phycisphaerales bacterium]
MPPEPPIKHAFLFAGGGTGGHIYPALAIIEQLKHLDPTCQAHILCSHRAIDSTILNTAAVPFTPIDAMPLSKRIGGITRFLRAWRPSIRQTKDQIRQLQSLCDQVTLVAMGGFVAGPAASAARSMGVPVVLVNLDAVPGKANRLIAKKAEIIYTAAAIEGFANWKRVHPIVRNQLSASMDQAQARAAYGLDANTKTLLITGGSQGATSINAYVRTLIYQYPEAFNHWQLIHQVGEKMPEPELIAYRDLCAQHGINAWIERYIDSMGQALASADLVMARCGAGTVAECWAARVPALFFPYPYHADEHQKHNAQPLAKANCAIILDDHIEADANMHAHAERILELLIGPDRLESMSRGFDALGSPDGARTIAEDLLR